jgi:tRNA nucleotidyltransferase (CCA-adding enzyme)
MQLNHRHFGSVIDFFHSRRHITDGVIGVLHPLSFVEDPTRIFRAVRFACRYRFALEPLTLRLLRGAVSDNLLAHLRLEAAALLRLCVHACVYVCV